MYGGDSVFSRMTSKTHVYSDTGVDAELDHRSHRVTEKLSESINTIANEPSVAFYRIQEHVRKTLPQLVEQKHEVEEVQQLVQGACFDTEYAGNAVKGMEKSVVHFQNIQELLKNAMFMKQQIDYEEARKRQNRLSGGSIGRPESAGGSKTEEGSDNMDESAVSTDSSLVASAHTNTEEDSQALVTASGKEPTEREDTQQDKDGAEREQIQEKTSAIENEDKVEERDGTDREKDTEDRREEKSTGESEEKQQAEGVKEQESTQHSALSPEDLVSNSDTGKS
ncbi:hypothetical protein ACOMHN_034600 [Nucella lapillus]